MIRLTGEQIDAIAESMPGGMNGFMRGWGWRQFARAIEEAIQRPPPTASAIAWAAYSRAFPEAMAGPPPLHVRGWQQPRVIEYARPQSLQWDEVQLPDMLAASEHAEPSGDVDGNTR